MNSLSSKRILLGVTGGIAAYKSADLVRRLQDQGADVRVVMTPAATEFITPLTMQALSNHPVSVDLLDTDTESVMGHIELARWADLIVIAPATADFIARMAFGHGDDLLSTICLAASCPIALAPAMNQAMWGKQNTQDNLESLIKMGVLILTPGSGLQACGEIGEGRLMEVADIVDHVINIFPSDILTGKHVLITAGPTREAIDPVRYISNHSSGKQGYAIAAAALEAGARVTLVSGPTSLSPPERAKFVPVQSAEDMMHAVMQALHDTDIFIGVAAVADYRPVTISQQKIKKQDSDELTIQLTKNPDILATVASHTPRPFVVGFAAETERLVEYATQKLTKKKTDMIIANNVADTSIGFNADDNETIVITLNGATPLPRLSKDTLARELIKIIAATAAGPEQTPATLGAEKQTTKQS